MNFNEICDYCRKKPNAEETFPFGDLPVCYKVEGKIFAQVYPNIVTLKCTAFQGQMLRQAYPNAVTRGYHCPPVQQPYWNTIDLALFPENELPYQIDLAYDAVIAKLPKKLRKEYETPSD